MVDLVLTSDFNFDIATCFVKNKIFFEESLSVPSPYGLKKVNFAVRKNETLHLIWTAASQKERWRAIDRDAILINRDQSKYSILRAEFLEFWYVGKALHNQTESAEKSIQGLQRIGAVCAGFKDNHVFSVYDTSSFSTFLQTLS